MRKPAQWFGDRPCGSDCVRMRGLRLQICRVPVMCIPRLTAAHVSVGLGGGAFWVHACDCRYSQARGVRHLELFQAVVNHLKWTLGTKVGFSATHSSLLSHLPGSQCSFSVGYLGSHLFGFLFCFESRVSLCSSGWF